ncbi:MAG: HNH endonuclease [Pseudomonadota bacterium]|nr:HNH endonuclease [Pseudomonadota bacterium]MDE3037576.1 HNH endonuclease [Pseudomonadota bacterium]
MWYRIFIAAALVLLPSAGRADDLTLPDPALTPGAVRSTDSSEICQPGYSRSVRHTSVALKRTVYREYGVTYRHGRYEVDHLIPLGIGGADTRENLWPQPRGSGWSAEAKDRLEWKLYRMVCHEGFDVRDLQRAIAKNWIAAYRRFCPTDKACPEFRRG